MPREWKLKVDYYYFFYSAAVGLKSLCSVVNCWSAVCCSLLSSPLLSSGLLMPLRCSEAQWRWPSMWMGWWRSSSSTCWSSGWEYGPPGRTRTRAWRRERTAVRPSWSEGETSDCLWERLPWQVGLNVSVKKHMLNPCTDRKSLLLLFLLLLFKLFYFFPFFLVNYRY